MVKQRQPPAHLPFTLLDSLRRRFSLAPVKGAFLPKAPLKAACALDSRKAAASIGGLSK